MSHSRWHSTEGRRNHLLRLLHSHSTLIARHAGSLRHSICHGWLPRLAHRSGETAGVLSLLLLLSPHASLSVELALESGLDEGEDLLEESVDLGLVEEVSSVSEVLLLEVLEVSLVVELLVLGLSDLLDFVVVDVELFTLECALVQLSLCK